MPVPAGGDAAIDLYTDLETVKAALQAKATDTVRDSLVTAAIRAACRQIDSRTGRRFYADLTPTARTFPVNGQSLIRGCDQILLVDDIAFDTGLAVAVGRPGAWTTVTGWATGPDNASAYGRAITEIYGYRGWLPYQGRVQITGLWGWPSVPDEIAQAALLQAVRLYRRRDSPEGVLGNSEWGVTRVSRVDPDVEALIAPFVVPTIA